MSHKLPMMVEVSDNAQWWATSGLYVCTCQHAALLTRRVDIPVSQSDGQQ